MADKKKDVKKKVAKKPAKPVGRGATPKSKSSKKPAGPKRQAKVITKTEDDYEPVNRWWEKDLDNGTNTKWDYLEHHGLMFQPDYEPHGVPLFYDGKAIKLDKDSEEIASHYAMKLESDYVHKDTFNKNFFTGFLKALPADSPIKDFSKCCFKKIHKHFMDEREAKKERQKNLSKEQKEHEKNAKKASEAHYRYAIMDDIREEVGAMAAEPPSLFLGRGEHPKMGQLKRRLCPEDVTINCSEDAPVPKCPVPGHAWSDIVHDNTVTWLGFYKDKVNEQFKYLMLGVNSGIKGKPDLLKYEKARKLQHLIDKIRDDYTQKWFSKTPVEKMIGVATYFIDRLALRAGNEKDTEEAADTVGTCSLRVEHVKFEENSSITFDFLGKDSIRYFNTVEVDPDVYTAMQGLCREKKPDQMIFDQIDPGTLNEYFQDFMPGLSVKVFRTYNASITLQRELSKFEDAKLDRSNPKAVFEFYTSANRQVAILCNHQKAVGKGHDEAVKKMADQLNDFEAQHKGLEAHLKKLKKDPLNAPKENKVCGKLPTGVEACKKKIQMFETKVTEQRRKIAIKEDNKTTALGTSKANYMDPRISVAFCKRVDLPIEKVFSATLCKKFPWAMYTDSEFVW